MLAKLSNKTWIKDCIKILIDKLDKDQLFQLSKFNHIIRIYNCIKILINKLSDNKLKCLDFIRTKN